MVSDRRGNVPAFCRARVASPHSASGDSERECLPGLSLATSSAPCHLPKARVTAGHRAATQEPGEGGRWVGLSLLTVML